VIAFEQYLVDNGYKIFQRHIEHKSTVNKYTNKFVPISSLALLENYYYPENVVESTLDTMKNWAEAGVLSIGLHEYQKPITLVWPRPNFVNENDRFRGFVDDDMNRLLKKHTPAEIILLTKTWYHSKLIIL
jgi:hypothetical protein